MSLKRSVDRTDTLLSHVNNVNLAGSRCPWHFEKPCFLILNNFDSKRFHCLYGNQSIQWKPYGILETSCDIPEHFYDLIKLREGDLGKKYTLKFATHFRERSGYTIGLFHMDREMYGPPIVKSQSFKETFYTFLVIFCALCKRFGGNVPNLKICTFLYTHTHPVITDGGATNSEKRERIGNGEYLNVKKWSRFLKRKTTRDVVRYVRLYHPQFFKKKARRGSKCILVEGDSLDAETHDLICKSSKMPLLHVLERFQHLMPDDKVREQVIGSWINDHKSVLKDDGD